MSLSPGTRLGPYEILAPLGAGGMGEVYRARDSRLGREVAVKVLPESFAEDQERLRRFEQEARATGSLSHPNLLALHDVGTHEGAPYLVLELLEGQTLREELGGRPLPARTAIDYAGQIAAGLSAAHAKGVVHRDLKPDNLFVTTDGRIKVLDFGLARLTVHEAAPEAQTATFDPPTSPGIALGTVGYMSPEQARGSPADTRSDIFSLGAILYEMLSGRRAFKRDTPADTISAILNDEPPALAGSSVAINPGLDRLVHRCLEKRPEHRFHSAHDLGLALEAISGGGSLSSPAIAAPAVRRRRHSALATLLGLLVLLAAFLAGERAAERPLPSYRQITFRRGTVGSARFSPDGQTIIYGAAWGADPWDVYSIRVGSTDARPLGLRGAGLMATSGNDVAVQVGKDTLARVPMDGGTPREILEGIDSADWTRDGAQFAVVRNVGDHQQLEYPIGKVLFETTGLQRIGSPRLSPSGDLVAFFDLPAGLKDAGGDLAVVDLAGRKRVLSKDWADTSGLAWSSNSSEVWFTAARAGFNHAIHAVTVSGQERLVARVAGSLELQDIGPDGHVLLTNEQRRWETRGRMAGDTAERDLSWLDGTLTPVLSPDGTRMVFQEWGAGGGLVGSIYFRKLDGSPAVHLGREGIPWDVSPDWKWVLCGPFYPVAELRVVPIGPGEAKTLPRGSVAAYGWALWHPDGERIVFQGNETSRPSRLYVQDLSGGLPRPFSQAGIGPSGFPGHTKSPDGSFLARPPGPRAAYVLYPVEGGEPHPIPGLGVDDEPIVWSDDGGSIFVQVGTGRTPTRVERIDVKTGRRQPWLELAAPDAAGAGSITRVRVTPNGRFYAYFYRRTLSDLYLVEGLK